MFDWTTIFGAELLWSALPFIILLGSLANERIDDDLSRHIGLNSQGAHIVRSLFRNSPTHALVPIATGLLFAFAGVIAVVSSDCGGRAGGAVCGRGGWRRVRVARGGSCG